MAVKRRWIFAVLATGFFLVFMFGIQPVQAATLITSGETQDGSLGISETGNHEFFGQAGNRVRIDADRTGGLINTEIILVDPDFIDETNTQPGGDLLDHVLQKSGIYTIRVQDAGLDNTGSYNITFLNLTAGPLFSTEDPDGGPISSGETLKGSILVSDMDAYQFYGEAGDRAIISAVTTSGLLNTEIILVDPDFVNETNTQPGGDLLDHVLQKTGTYTILVQDAGLDNTGSYNITFLNLTAGPLFSTEDPNGGPISSGETLEGSILVSDMDAYQFYGEAGDRAIISAVTSSGLLNTEIILVDPDFVNETNTQPGGDLLDHVLQKTGTYTIVVQDAGYNNTGYYKVTILKLPGTTSSQEDCDGRLIGGGFYPLGVPLSGKIVVSDMDVYQFYGEAGDRAIIAAVTSSGLLNTEIILVDPDFIDEANTQPGGDLLDHNLQKTGLYTIIVQDYGLNNTGYYNITLNKLPNTVRPGIYDPSPATDCVQSEDVTLTWDPVAGATGYDVLFGTDVLAPLLPLCTNVPVSSCAANNLEKSEVYYWTVVAHKPGGAIQGAVNWFVTEFACDLNHDCSCNILDYQLFIQDWGRTDCGTPPGSGNPPNDCECDLDTNGRCNILDYQIFIQDWGRTVCH